jgi:hypothetical protein
VVELATNAETATGTDADRAVTPAALASLIGSVLQAYDADLTTLGAGGAGARTFLGLAIGTDVQAYSAVLAALVAGTDLAVTAGGTGASTAEAARANLGAAALPASSTFPVGFTGYMRYTSSTSLADGATTAGTNVRTPAYTGDFGSAGLNVATGGVQTGTWRNDNGTTLRRISSNNDGEQFGYMTRTA